jgi:hypothetical protein
LFSAPEPGGVGRHMDNCLECCDREPVVDRARGLEKANAVFFFALAAYDLISLHKLLEAPA